MDNLSVNVVAEGRKALAAAISLLKRDKAEAWRVIDGALVLYWATKEGATPLPYPLSGEGLLEFIDGWLKQAPLRDEPDHDGDNGRGFSLSTNSWGQGPDGWQSFAAIRPEWAMYGK